MMRFRIVRRASSGTGSEARKVSPMTRDRRLRGWFHCADCGGRLGRHRIECDWWYGAVDFDTMDPDDTSWWSWREKFCHWFVFEWWPTRRWMRHVWLWWGYHVRGYPKPPPLDQDPVFQALFGDGGDGDHAK
jgi:hypothetical protein